MGGDKSLSRKVSWFIVNRLTMVDSIDFLSKHQIDINLKQFEKVPRFHFYQELRSCFGEKQRQSNEESNLDMFAMKSFKYDVLQ